MIKSLIGINKNLDEIGSKDASTAGCLGNNHLGLLGLLGHMTGQSGYTPFSLLTHLYNNLIIDKLLADIISLL